MNKNMIAASILAADWAYLADDCKAMLEAGANALHLDVMDNHYVPNLTFGANVCAALNKAGIKTFYDVHLMVEKPEQYVDAFAKAGANCFTFHPSTTKNVAGLLQKIHDSGMQAGLAYNPDERIDMDDDALRLCDMILIMSVFPGFGGQAFLPEVLDKVPPLKARCTHLGLDPMIAIDGGVNVDTIKQAKEAGIDYFVMGSALFGVGDYQQRMEKFRKVMA